eukprot:1978884-Prymnesium_polylepis.1
MDHSPIPKRQPEGGWKGPCRLPAGAGAFPAWAIKARAHAAFALCPARHAALHTSVRRALPRAPRRAAHERAPRFAPPATPRCTR